MLLYGNVKEEDFPPPEIVNSRSGVAFYVDTQAAKGILLVGCSHLTPNLEYITSKLS